MRTWIPVYAMAHLSDLPSFPVSPGLYGSLFIPEMVWQLPFDLAGKFFSPVFLKKRNHPGPDRVAGGANGTSFSGGSATIIAFDDAAQGHASPSGVAGIAFALMGWEKPSAFRGTTSCPAPRACHCPTCPLPGRHP